METSKLYDYQVAILKAIGSKKPKALFIKKGAGKIKPKGVADESYNR